MDDHCRTHTVSLGRSHCSIGDSLFLFWRRTEKAAPPGTPAMSALLSFR